MTDQDRAGRLLDQLMPCPGPPPGFVERVLAAAAGQGRTTRRVGSWSWAAGIGIGVAVAIAIVLAVRGNGRPLAAGHLVAGARQTITIGSRAVAVVEPGAELAWSLRGERVHVDQPSGEVFYRVEHGGPFDLVTPAGEIEVTGTCFRVTVALDSPRSGEAVASDGLTVVVDVMEGAVKVRNDAGERMVAAGESARLALNQPPQTSAAMLRSSSGSDDEALVANLLARERSSRGRAERAEARVRELEQRLGAGSPREDAALPPEGKFLALSSDERKALARHCRFRWALPMHLTQWANPDTDGKVALSPDERAQVTRAMEEQRGEFVETLRGIYAEVVGDAQAASALSPMSLFQEIDAKSRKQDGVDARRLILAEWAAVATPPSEAALANRPAVERLWRLVVSAPDAYVARLEPIVGRERARQVAGSSLHVMVYGTEQGCPTGTAD